MTESTAAAATGAASTDTTGTEQQAVETGKPDPAAEAEKWKALARKHEATAKANAEKAQQFDALSEASKTDAQRLEERASKAEQQLTPLQAENARLKVALAKGLPADLADRLKGDTPEEIAADADALLALVGTAQQQVPDLRAAAGQRPNQATGGQQSADDWLRSMAGRGR